MRRYWIVHRTAKEAYGLRLRYVGTHQPAVPVELSDGLCFHLFLSHAWTTGANQMRICKERLKLMCPELKVFLE
jgi:hypothetical protein